MRKWRRLWTLLVTLSWVGIAYSQSTIPIPDTLAGTEFTLQIRDTTHEFYPGQLTMTMGVNADYLGPTLLLNAGDSVHMQLQNRLMDTTTIHWHGMHVSPQNDGGPHIVIPPGADWDPRFVVRDQAAMYWYHPHLHMMTNLHATMGAAGLVIVRDAAEGALPLPRQYGIDDFPLVLQTKAFNASKQIVVGDALDSVPMVNGAIRGHLGVPAQVVRLRLLNACSERVLNLGFVGNVTFYQIGTDGGLLDAPVPLTRLRLAGGERAEILLDLTGLAGQSLVLQSFAAELPNAMYGAAQPGMGTGQTIPGYSSNPLNGTNFPFATLDIQAPTANPVTAIPSALITNTPYPLSAVTASRTLTFTPTTMGPTAIQGPFLINGVSFDMGVINLQVTQGATELWTLSNQSPIAHPFHIHDVQFYLTDLNGAAPPANMAGRKDVVLVPAMQTVQFITRFDDFCDPMYPYMYHCHMLPHEDDGMMGQFLVNCPATGVQEVADIALTVVPNPAGERCVVSMANEEISRLLLHDMSGRKVMDMRPQAMAVELDLGQLPSGIYAVTAWTRSGVCTQRMRKE